ncbi:Rrf2 family transcriptional regulator [Paenibacillus sp. CGMCC 1.16610]|uniref:Rrf2 family transcriptional regulator n=1 Tax=Paenibacillus anseongense TaxID=2682845 RepID=A0ABW9UNM4_9BACL|nr:MULTISPECIES: Rrf2 family transcriptional regulator [Paenibacillus]MBA2939850.1 Rrf2 family transcriptional regulator [Paenibacillus sp. CGMCC 1.16610]MVQ39510.1 Rrf2 family transcriptional regulator [Paenibacillus anseongense]
MQYSIGVEYGLHCLVYLIDIPPNSSIGIKDLATFQGISESYLSKIFSKLAKSGIVSSVSGVKGGYRLAKLPEDISFWDVVEAVEGATPIFQCKNIKDNSFLCLDEDVAACTRATPCVINQAMLEAEVSMRNSLRSKTLSWLNEELKRVLTPQSRKKTHEYFANVNQIPDEKFIV